MSSLSLVTAERFAKAAIVEARKRSLNPVSVAVIDASGYLKFALREDGASIATVDIAQGKAAAALSFGCTSRQIADALAGDPLAGPSVIARLQGRVVLLAGGTPITAADGSIIGAIAAAGDMPDNDEAIVLIAIAS